MWVLKKFMLTISQLKLKIKSVNFSVIIKKQHIFISGIPPSIEIHSKWCNYSLKYSLFIQIQHGKILYYIGNGIVIKLTKNI